MITKPSTTLVFVEPEVISISYKYLPGLIKLESAADN